LVKVKTRLVFIGQVPKGTFLGCVEEGLDGGTVPVAKGAVTYVVVTLGAVASLTGALGVEDDNDVTVRAGDSGTFKHLPLWGDESIRLSCKGGVERYPWTISMVNK